MGVFSKFFIYDDKKLSQDFPLFWQEHSEFIISNARGFGYWIWKPFLILSCLESMNEGEGLLYLDGGCHLNKTPGSMLKLKEYLQHAQDHEILVTQLYDGQFGFESLSEKSWTKKQLLDFLQLSESDQESGQYQSGIIFIINNARNRQLVSDWFELSKSDGYRWLTGKSLAGENYPSFVEHRFDQSIFSALAKNRGAKSFRDETYWEGSWSTQGRDYPIWAIRNTTGIDTTRMHYWDIPDRLVRMARTIKSRTHTHFSEVGN